MNVQTATINLTFSPAGVTIKVSGVAGPACASVTKALESLGQRTKDIKTEDYDRDPDFGLVSSDGLSMG